MAKSLEVTQSHTLPPEEARTRMERLLDGLHKQYGLRTSWIDATRASVEGKGVKGTASLGEGRVAVQVSLSLPASMMASKIDKALRETLEREFA